MNIALSRLLGYFFVLTFLYSFYWDGLGRVSALPISYVPYLILFAVISIVWFWRGNYKINRTEAWLVATIGYFLIQPVLLLNSAITFSFTEYAIDFGMFLVYSLAYVSTVAVCSRLCLEVKLKLLERAVDFIAAATVLGSIRFFTIDSWIGVGDFFNIVPPLQYRFFEVLLFIFGFTVSAFSYLTLRLPKYKYYMILFIVGILLAGSRTGMLSMLFVILLIVVGAGGKTKLRVKINLLSLFATIVIFVVVLGSIFDRGVTERISRLSEITLFAKLDMDAAISEQKDVKRILYLTGGLEMFADHPWVGVGLGNFQERFPKALMNEAGTDHVTRPHNMYISFLATTGVLGSLLFFGWLANLWVELRSNCARCAGGSTLLYKPAFVFITSLFVFFLGYEVQTNPLFWGLMGVLVGCARNNGLRINPSNSEKYPLMMVSRG